MAKKKKPNPEEGAQQKLAELKKLLETELSPKEVLCAARKSLVTNEEGNVVVKGSGAVSTQGGTSAGKKGVAIAKNVYNLYLGGSGATELTEAEFNTYLQVYLECIKTYYRDARLFGLESLTSTHDRPVKKLTSVFVPLSLNQAQPLFQKEVEGFSKDREDSAALSDLDNMEIIETEDMKGPEVSLNNILGIHNRLAIIGGPGSGKSTLLAYLALTLSNNALGEENEVPLGLTGMASVVPMVIPLRAFKRYAQVCEQAKHRKLEWPSVGTLAGLIPWYLKEQYPLLEESKDFFKRLLLGKGCLIMLDGLDEVVSREERGYVRQEVENLVNRAFPGNRIVVTSREIGYQDNAVFGDDFVRLDVEPLNPSQIEALVRKWCVQLFDRDADARRKELTNAIEEINGFRNRRRDLPLINSPLMVTMVVSVKWGDTELPRERAKLYEACVRAILQAQYLPEDRSRTELVEWGGAWEDQRDWLACLALAMHENGEAGAVASHEKVQEVLLQVLSKENLIQFLEAVRGRGGLLEEKGEVFQFLHLTFQEFLVARWLAKLRDKAYTHLQGHLTDPWWREVFLLTYGFAQIDFKPFAEEFLHWLSNQKGQDEEQLAGLELAGAALLELDKPQNIIRQEQAKKIEKMLSNPEVNASGFLRAQVGDTLARLHDPRFRPDAWFLPNQSLLGFVEIPAGPFIMGSEEGYKDEKPRHVVTLPQYYISRYPVTVAQFNAFVDETKFPLPKPKSIQGIVNHPVVNVSWYEALAYCDWLTEQLRDWGKTPEPLATLLRKGDESGVPWVITLPSEAEWEKAARGTDGQTYPWGLEQDLNKANFSAIGIHATSAVGCFPGGASPFGVEEMSGNVWDWTRSLYEEYPYPEEKEGRFGRERMDSKSRRVLRGSSFFSTVYLLRCAFRGSLHPKSNCWNISFRVVASPSFSH